MSRSRIGVVTAAFILFVCPFVWSFSSPIFATTKSATRKVAPSLKPNVNIELPDFDELFGRIQAVSPLARTIVNREKYLGFEAADKNDPFKWKTLEKNNNPNVPVNSIQKIDNFQDLGPPILRLRSSLKGPCVGERFALMIMDLEARKKWDPQIENVYEAYPIRDLDTANIVIGDSKKYGDCARLGIGYCKTKSNVVVSPREQLTLCGIQDFPDSSSMIWGVEMEDRHDHLLPGEERTVRARSHLFSTTLVPTGPDSFDVEYVLQLEIGGKIPSFLTTPIVSETCKLLFKEAKKYFASGEVEKYLRAKEAIEDTFSGRKGILFVP